MIDIIGFGILIAICLCIAWLYVRNIMKLIKQLETSDYGIILIARVIGVFFPVWGIVMGFVNTGKSTPKD